MLKVTLLVLAAVVASCSAQSESFRFSEYNTLVCYQSKYIYGVGNVETPVPHEYIGLEPGVPYQPLQSGFTSPVIGPMPRDLQERLLYFLGSDYNDRLTYVGETRPTIEPTVPSTILPLRYPPVSSGAINGGAGTIYQPPVNSTEQSVRAILRSFLDPPTEAQENVIVNVVNRLNDRCEVMVDWIRLPHGQFFPQWVSASFCNTSSSCSMPFGLTCQPVLVEETLVRIVVLRWGCCWNIVNNQWRWECGWRKVYIPFITQCRCACFPILTADSLNGRMSYSHTGRIGGTFYTTVGGLNT